MSSNSDFQHVMRFEPLNMPYTNSSRDLSLRQSSVARCTGLFAGVRAMLEGTLPARTAARVRLGRAAMAS